MSSQHSQNNISLQLTDLLQKSPELQNVMAPLRDTTDRTLKDMFKGEIRAGFLIETEKKVIGALGTYLFPLYDFRINENSLVEGMGGTPDYEICKIIIGIHHANTVFLTKEEVNTKIRSEEYKNCLIQQAVREVYLRRYAAAFFRTRPFVCGERFIYYPVPYALFAFCARMNLIFTKQGGINKSSNLISLIMNKSTAALSLMEDGFFDSAYMPCRTVIEMYVKLLLFRTDLRLFDIARMFSGFDLEKTNCSGQYCDEFNNLFEKRVDQRCKSKVEYMHYGFVDAVDDYHDVVKQNPYSIHGIITYLKSISDEDTSNALEMLENFYQACHGYAHGNVIIARYPLLHYFELSMILGLIVPKVYEMVCNDAGVDKQFEMGIDLLGQFRKDFEMLMEQYKQRSTEKFELEKGKYKYYEGV